MQLKLDPNDYWNPEIYKINSEYNIKNVDYTIADIEFNKTKVMICGRGEFSHPNFHPRFSTPTTNIDSELYVTVDHDPNYVNYITRKGCYVLSLIVDPVIAKKILKMGGKIFWFSPDYFNFDIPKIIPGKFPIGNSGLSAISLASYLKVKFILLSGIQLTRKYNQYLDGKEIVFDNVTNSGTKIFSLDGVLAEKLSYDDWCNL